MPLLHPLLKEMRSSSLDDMSEARVERIFDAAGKAGVTPAERAILARSYNDNADEWPEASRRAFADAYHAAPNGPRALGGSLRGPDAEDLSSRMKTVWMPNLSDPIQQSYAADMARLGAELGFQLQLSLPAYASLASLARGLVRRSGLPVEELDKVVEVSREDNATSVWGEDNKILANAADPAHPVRVLVPPDVSDWALESAQGFTSSEGYHAYRAGFQGAVDQRREQVAAVEKAGRLGRAVSVAKSYIEGGNLLTGVTSDGQPYGMIGRDTVVITAFHLFETQGFSERQLQSTIAKLEASGALGSAEIRDIADKLYDAGGSQWGTNQSRLSEARRFGGLLELARQTVAEDAGIDPARMVVVTQPDFHIDMHMRPMAPGEVLVQDPRAAMSAIREAYYDPEAQSWEREELAVMYENANRDAEELGPVYDEIFAELDRAGLIGIPAPGVFEGRYRLANFMNGVPGTTDAGVPYYLTNASSIAPLERAFRSFMARVGIDRVELLGAEGGGPETLSMSERSLELSGGLDCREVDHAGAIAPSDDLTRALRGGAWA